MAETLLFLAVVIENISVMDKAVERPRGLSRASKLAVIAAVVVAAGVAFAIPTIRRWSKAERPVAASSVRIGQVSPACFLPRPAALPIEPVPRT